MQIGGKTFDTDNRVYLMGILNVTPDSFSDGGRYKELDAALFHAEEMVKEGAAILDVGRESTRPGHTKISVDEEISRTALVIEKLRDRFDVPVSIDTYKSRVAEAAQRLTRCGIKALWNFAHLDLDVPEDVVVENVHLSESLMRLSYRVCSMQDKKKEELERAQKKGTINNR